MLCLYHVHLVSAIAIYFVLDVWTFSVSIFTLDFDIISTANLCWPFSHNPFSGCFCECSNLVTFLRMYLQCFFFFGWLAGDICSDIMTAKLVLRIQSHHHFIKCVLFYLYVQTSFGDKCMTNILTHTHNRNLNDVTHLYWML